MKKVLITGAAGGLGLAAAKYFVEKGCKVYALDFNQKVLDEINDPNIVPVQVDVTSDESVVKALEVVQADTDILDGIINFAGILTMGAMIELPASSAGSILGINLVGMYRINQQFFPLLQKGKGRIINISSETGVLSPVPFSGFYTMSKHAVEVYSDTIRRELKFLGIQVIKIRPGSFATQMQGGATGLLKNAMENTTLFKANMQKGLTMAEKNTGGAKDPRILAAVIYKAFTANKPKLAYGANINKQLRFISMLPERLQDFI